MLTWTRTSSGEDLCDSVAMYKYAFCRSCFLRGGHNILAVTEDSPITEHNTHRTFSSYRPSFGNMTSTRVELPRSTGSLKQYRIICVAPYYHKPFSWSRKYKSGYNNLYAHDLPTDMDLLDLTAVAEDECHTTLLWHAEKYAARPWRRHKDW